MILKLLRIWRTIQDLLEPHGGATAMIERLTALF